MLHSMYYLFATQKDLYVFDEHLAPIEVVSLTEDDAYSIATGVMTQIEQELFTKYEGLLCCNYKKDHPYLRDMAILNQILSVIQPVTFADKHDFLRRVARFHIQKAVTWDMHVSQAIRSTDELDKSINLLSKRMREWYEWHLPELSKKIASHEKLAELIITESDEHLHEISVTKQVSLGADFSDIDMQAVRTLAEQIVALAKQRERTRDYIEVQMTKHMPNFTYIAGAQIAAKLLSIAGNVTRLSRLTASTIQVYGAEKALFRHLKTGARPPKYGILFQHKLVSTARPQKRGKMARMLANALSLCTKADYFAQIEGREATTELAQTQLAKVEAAFK